ncbi:unnamed protein product [marine sediment metagenome]|uniref:Uncharacterized protein n=1 Tax=marine sediment metagenome TaxID=412755 RepID=X0W6Z9_9ZZZZ
MTNNSKKEEFLKNFTEQSRSGLDEVSLDPNVEHSELEIVAVQLINGLKAEIKGKDQIIDIHKKMDIINEAMLKSGQDYISVLETEINRLNNENGIN